jgi:hypothetical protein
MVKTQDIIKIDLSKSTMKERVNCINTLLEVRRLLKEFGINVEIKKKKSRL